MISNNRLHCYKQQFPTKEIGFKKSVLKNGLHHIFHTPGGIFVTCTLVDDVLQTIIHFYQNRGQYGRTATIIINYIQIFLS